MFQDLVISIVIVPVLIGIQAAKFGNGARDRLILRVTWGAYGLLWFGLLYYLRYRWR